jgi:nucleoside-diphosphate-sugar epimerase
LEETSPQNAVTRKGQIRVEMERRLEAAADAGEITALIVRSGDFFGGHAGNSWLGQGMIKPGARPRSITYPGKRGVGHAWAYLPDVAETMVRLLERGRLDAFATFHMEGQWDEDGRRMIEAIRGVLDAPGLPARRLPWTAVRLAAPFVPLFRELLEMKYLWDQPLRLSNRRLVAFLGEEPRTPLDVAIREALIGLGCLPAASDS